MGGGEREANLKNAKTERRHSAETLIMLWAVFRIRIRIHRIHMFLGHPDPLVRGMDPDPDPSIIYHHAKIVRKTLIPTIL